MQTRKNKYQQGYLALSVLLAVTVLVLLVATSAAVLISSLGAQKNIEQQYQLKYLAEAGIIFGINRIKNVPGFFTDGIPQEPLKTWLLEESLGQTLLLDSGGAKIVCPDQTGQLYAIGFLGKTIQASAGYVCIKIKFEENPFRVVEWDII